METEVSQIDKYVSAPTIKMINGMEEYIIVIINVLCVSAIE
jgi:hypothetical protein